MDALRQFMGGHIAWDTGGAESGTMPSCEMTDGEPHVEAAGALRLKWPKVHAICWKEERQCYPTKPLWPSKSRKGISTVRMPLDESASRFGEALVCWET